MSGDDFHLTLSDAALDTLAERVASRVAQRLNGGTGPAPWMTAEEAADYLRCSISRLRKLTMRKLVPAHRDGGRVLYRREDLNAFIAGGGASTGR